MSKSYILYLNLCDNLPIQYCGKSTKVCIKRTQDDVLIVSGTELKPCKLKIKVNSILMRI